MKTLRTLLSEPDLSRKALQLIENILGSEDFGIFIKYLDHYRITVVIKGNTLIIKQFFHSRKKWEEIALSLL